MRWDLKQRHCGQDSIKLCIALDQSETPHCPRRINYKANLQAPATFAADFKNVSGCLGHVVSHGFYNNNERNNEK